MTDDHDDLTGVLGDSLDGLLARLDEIAAKQQVPRGLADQPQPARPG